jgi:hypothetical protein
LVVYTREPHAGEGGFCDVAQPQSFEERTGLARRLLTEDALARGILIDEMNDSIQTSYGGLPNMLYLIDPAGRVAAKWQWADAETLEEYLQEVAVPPA